MKALILAAGFGTRLLPYTEKTPKPLFPIAGRPLLDITIENLIKAGCEAITVNTHHLADDIDNYLKNREYPIPVYTRFEPKILGTGGAIRNITDFWEQRPFIVINSDIITDIDLKKVYEFHMSHNHPATLVLHHCPDFNFVSIDKKKFIKGFSQKDRVGNQMNLKKLAFTGIQVLDPEILDFIPKGSFYSSINAFRDMMSTGRKIKAYTEKNHYWTDVGTPASYMEAVYKKTSYHAFTAAWKEPSSEKISRTKLKGDGSGRTWYRLASKDRSLIMADHGIRNDKPVAEVDSFISIGRHLYAAGIPVPKIFLGDRFSGLVFMEDLGDHDLQSAVRNSKTTETIMDHYKSVIKSLIKMSISGAKNFDTAWTFQTDIYSREMILENECRYFVEAFLQKHLGYSLQYKDFKDEFHILAEKALSFSTNGFMHRDMQSRNIMLKNGKYYFIDFQGGRLGPIQYDLASLLIDPYVELSTSMQSQLLDYCIKKLSDTIEINTERFKKGYYYCTLTRNLQILGAYGFLSNVMKKTYFKQYIRPAVITLQRSLSHPYASLFTKLRETANNIGGLE